MLPPLPWPAPQTATVRHPATSPGRPAPVSLPRAAPSPLRRRASFSAPSAGLHRATDLRRHSRQGRPRRRRSRLSLLDTAMPCAAPMSIHAPARSIDGCQCVRTKARCALVRPTPNSARSIDDGLCVRADVEAHAYAVIWPTLNRVWSVGDGQCPVCARR